MAQKDKGETCCSPVSEKIGSCKVEAVISVDERGQMVLPKETRERANIRAGDKLALIIGEKGGKVCCLSLIKIEELTDMVKGKLGPVMTEIFK